MKAYEIQDDWGLERLTMVDRVSPPVGPKQIRVRLAAMSLNYRDLLMVRGHYNPRIPLPLTPMSDGVGEVVALGEGTTRFALGDRVCLSFCQDWIGGEPTSAMLKTTLGGPIDGVLAEEIVVDQHGAVMAPEHLTNEEAACLPCAGLTAWSALQTYGGLTAGETVLVLGTGGVSIFALQLAKAAGAHVIVTSSSDSKLERATELGADQVINYKANPAWGKAVKQLTGGRGVDHVVEVGGARTLAQSLKAVRPGGKIAMIGVLSGAQEPLNILPILMQNIRLQGILVGHRDGFEAMNRAVTQSMLRPVIDRIFAFDEAPAAFEYLGKALHFGKVVIKV